MNILDLIIAIVFGILIIFSFVQHEEITSLNSEVLAYHEQIEMLQTESQKKQAEANDAYEAAQVQLQQIQESNKKILASKVPKDCQGSIKWIINQAQFL